LIEQINADDDINEKIESVSDLIALFSAHEVESEIRQVFRLNKLLIDIIEKVREQNKKNQFFLNKAIHNIKDIKQDFTGKKNFTTYGPSGAVKNKGP
jgi:flagellar biosynthesis/type III secretory pathway chaperone